MNTANRPSERNALVAGHMDMARRIAGKVARRVPRCVGRDELESAAFLGLTEAATRFDPSRGEPFIAYAAKRVRGAILDELRRNDMLTRGGRKGARRLADAVRAVEAQTGGPAGSAEVASKMGMSEDDLVSMQARLQAASVVSLDDAGADSVTAAVQETPVEQLAAEQRRRALSGALKALPEREAAVLSMCYQDGLTLKEIGEIFGVSESRVCQLRGRALRSLRAVMAEHVEA